MFHSAPGQSYIEEEQSYIEEKGAASPLKIFKILTLALSNLSSSFNYLSPHFLEIFSLPPFIFQS